MIKGYPYKSVVFDTFRPRFLNVAQKSVAVAYICCSDTNIARKHIIKILIKMNNIYYIKYMGMIQKQAE